MLELDQISKVKKGDIVIVSDYHTLSSNDGEDLHAQITEANCWEHKSMTVFGWEFEIHDMTFMVLIRRIKDANGDYVAEDLRMMRLWDTIIWSEFDGVSAFKDKAVLDEHEDDECKDPPDSLEIDFKNFSIIHDGEEEDGELAYAIKKPYPFWDMNKKGEGNTVAMCEYGALDTDDDPLPTSYWAKTAMIEWYAYVGDSGKDGLVTLWFGWDISLNDLNVMKG